MPTKLTNKQTRKSVKKNFEIDSENFPVETEKNSFTMEEKDNKRIKPVYFVVVLILIIIGLAGYFFKDKYLAAIVNGKPVFKLELSKRMESVYGKETLENLIVERLIGEEVVKNGVLVTDEEINKEVEKVSATLGSGVKIEDALKFQGLTMEEFKKQLKMRLQVNKLLEKNITVSTEEVDTYIKDNGKTLIATAEAEKKVEAEQKIKEQKISDSIQTWISDLLAKAKITRFLK